MCRMRRLRRWVAPVNMMQMLDKSSYVLTVTESNHSRVKCGVTCT